MRLTPLVVIFLAAFNLVLALEVGDQLVLPPPIIITWVAIKMHTPTHMEHAATLKA